MEPPAAHGRIGSLAERTAQLAIEIRVSNLEASIEFYRQVGLSLERQTPSFAAMQIDGRYLLLSLTAAVSTGPTPPNLRIMVDDIEAALAKAAACGWPVRSPVADHGYGLRDFTVGDPDGYELRFAVVSLQSD